MQENYHCNICHQTFPYGEFHACSGTPTSCHNGCPGYPPYQPDYQDITRRLDRIEKLLLDKKAGKEVK